MPDQRIEELANLLAAKAFRSGRTAEQIVAREAGLLSAAQQAELVAIIKSTPRTY